MNPFQRAREEAVKLREKLLRERAGDIVHVKEFLTKAPVEAKLNLGVEYVAKGSQELGDAEAILRRSENTIYVRKTFEVASSSRASPEPLRTLEMTVMRPLLSGPSLPSTVLSLTAAARRAFLCSTLTKAMMCSLMAGSEGGKPDRLSWLFLIHLLLGPSRSRPRAGGGWARPLLSREGVGVGWSSHAAKKQCAVPGPPPVLIPPQVPLVTHGGAAGGSAVGRSAHGLQLVSRSAALQTT